MCRPRACQSRWEESVLIWGKSGLFIELVCQADTENSKYGNLLAAESVRPQPRPAAAHIKYSKDYLKVCRSVVVPLRGWPGSAAWVGCSMDLPQPAQRGVGRISELQPHGGPGMYHSESHP